MMFLIPPFRVPWLWAAGAFLTGALVLAIPLVRSTRLERQGEIVMMRRSRAFILILLVLVAMRLALRDYVGRVLPPAQTAGVFFILAFGMIVPWRVWMWKRYREIVRSS